MAGVYDSLLASYMRRKFGQQVVERGALVSFFRSIDKESWLRMWINLNEVQRHCQFQVSPDSLVAIEMKSVLHIRGKHT